LNNESTNNKELIVKSKTENLSAIRDFISRNALSAGIKKDMIENIMLAVDEACTNIIRHAYSSTPDGEIKIKLNYNLEKFTILIIDYGNSFDPEIVPDPDLRKYYDEGKAGGLGMYLMKTLMDEVKYISVPGKYNQVFLSKNINESQN